MALSSMTGFARADGVSGAYTWTWELKSVNAKGLDVRLRLPVGYFRTIYDTRFSRLFPTEPEEGTAGRASSENEVFSCRCSVVSIQVVIRRPLATEH